MIGMDQAIKKRAGPDYCSSLSSWTLFLNQRVAFWVTLAGIPVSFLLATLGILWLFGGTIKHDQSLRDDHGAGNNKLDEMPSSSLRTLGRFINQDKHPHLALTWFRAHARTGGLVKPHDRRRLYHRF